MTDNIVSNTVVSVGGYDSSQNHLNLDTNFPGMASDLLNYEVGLNGGYRKINGFQYFDSNWPEVTSVATPAEGKVLGVFIFNDGGVDKVMAARKIVGANTYRFYTYDSGTGWSAVGSPTMQMTVGSAVVNKVRYAQVNFGNIDYIIFVDGTNFAQVYDGTTWYALDPSGLGTLVSPGGNQMLSKPGTVTVYKNHVFFGYDFDYPGVVCHLAPESVVDATVASGAGQLVIGFNVNQIKPFRDTLYIFGRNGIKSITVTGTDFVVNGVTDNIGNLATDSVQEIAGDLIFLAPDGLRPVSGTDKIGDVQIATVSKQIQRFVQGLISSREMEYVDSLVIRGKSQYRIFFADPNGSDRAGAGIIGGLRLPDVTNWEFSRLSGFRISCATSDYIDGVETILHGDYSGNVHQQEVGNSFNGEKITTIYSTPFLTFGEARVRKMLRSLSMYLRLEGPLSMNIRTKFDWDDGEVLTPANYHVENNQVISEYGDGSLYGDGSVYGSYVLNPLIETAIHGSCFSVKFSFTTSDTDGSHSILGFITEFTTQARR